MKAFANGSSVQKSIKESIQNYRESKSTPTNTIQYSAQRSGVILMTCHPEVHGAL
jgi:hypothetical protein